MAIKMVTIRRDGNRTINWQGMKETPNGKLWIRYREQAFDSMQVRHSNAFGTAWKSFWFCRGVGKVKEVGDQIEELIEHQVTWP
jgi:hypothetical protein